MGGRFGVRVSMQSIKKKTTRFGPVIRTAACQNDLPRRNGGTRAGAVPLRRLWPDGRHRGRRRSFSLDEAAYDTGHEWSSMAGLTQGGCDDDPAAYEGSLPRRSDRQPAPARAGAKAPARG